MNVFKKRNQHPILVNIAKEFKEKAPAEWNSNLKNKIVRDFPFTKSSRIERFKTNRVKYKH
jgi:hypothetical protein